MISYDTRSRRLENDRGKIVPSGKAELYKITFEDERTVLASPNHPFFVITPIGSSIVRTKDLTPGAELADFSNRILHCYNCNRVFYRQYLSELYERYFCSLKCKDVFFGSLSKARGPKARRLISAKAHESLRRRGTQQSRSYRRTRSEIAKRLHAAGKIPNVKVWNKGEGAWLGKKLQEDHRQRTSEGCRRYFSDHPEIRFLISERAKKSLAEEDGRYRKLVREGFFKGASKKAYLASVEYWKRNGFRSNLESRMAELLGSWNIPYERECLIFRNEEGRTYPFTVDFVIGEKTAVFVNGCWWHVCPECGVRAEYEKQRRNMAKDLRHYAELKKLGYKVVVVWEHELRDPEKVRLNVLPRIYETIGISGGGLPRIRHSKVRLVEHVGVSDVLNISVEKNSNFVLANGILTHNTSDAQTALRRIMEESSSYTRFLLICNYSSGIIEPLQSRCAIFRFRRLDEQSVVSHLAEIAKKEKVKVDGKGVLGEIYEATQGDLRQAINLLQAAAVSGVVDSEKVKSVAGTAVKSRVGEVIRLAIGGDFDEARTKMIEMTRVYGVPERDFLRFANEVVNSMELADIASVIRILAEYDFRLVEGAQPELQLTAMLAELSALKRKSG